MAKISARGAHKVREVRTASAVYVLRSDGAILRALVIDGRREGYTVIAKPKGGLEAASAWLDRIEAVDRQLPASVWLGR